MLQSTVQKYDVANVAVGDLVSGTQSTFYTDMFGRIAYIESAGGVFFNQVKSMVGL